MNEPGFQEGSIFTDTTFSAGLEHTCSILDNGSISCWGRNDFGQLGLGVLIDLAGKDRYAARYSAQGAALLGVGVVLEAAGDDRYRIESDGQGFGGAGGGPPN